MGACRWSDQTPSKRTAALCLGVPRPLSEHRVCAHTAPTPRVRTWPCPVDGDPLSQSFPPGNGTDRKGCREIFASFFFFFFFMAQEHDCHLVAPQMPTIIAPKCQSRGPVRSTEHLIPQNILPQHWKGLESAFRSLFCIWSEINITSQIQEPEREDWHFRAGGGSEQTGERNCCPAGWPASEEGGWKCHTSPPTCFN